MPALETQVGQIYINNKKLSKSFVSLFSEKIMESEAELFALLEIPLLNSASSAESEKISKVISAVLQKNFKRINPNAFENAISQVNEELGKIAAQGQTSWVGKMNACLAVRQNENLSVASSGKVHAFLFRNKQFSDIAGNSKDGGALKTFENFVLGKVAKKDLLIFSTSQLFNYVSIERLQKILSEMPILESCQAVANLIKETAEASVSFGTFILEIGSTKDFAAQNAFAAKQQVQDEKIFAAALQTENNPKAESSQKNSSLDKIKSFGSAAKKLAERAISASKELSVPKINIQNINSQLIKERAKNYTDLKKIKELPRAKKFFLAAAAIFFLLLVINIAVAARMHFVKKANQDITAKLNDIQQKIDDANAAYIYNDQASANKLTTAARDELNAIPLQKNQSITDQENKISIELTALENTAEHIKTLQATELFKYNGGAVNMIRAFGRTIYLINNDGGLFVPYSLNDNSQGAEFSVSTTHLSDIVAVNNVFIARDSSGNVYQINASDKNAVKTSWILPAESTGLAVYGSPAKLYTMDKKSGAIVSASQNSPLSQYLQLDLNNALGLAIDGSVYLLEKDGIKKFVSKQEKTFDQNGLNYSSNAIIKTDASLANVYVLDPDKNRLIVLDKKRGDIIAQYTSNQFKKLKDFIVDEKNKVAYILNDQSVLVIHL